MVPRIRFVPVWSLPGGRSQQAESHRTQCSGTAPGGPATHLAWAPRDGVQGPCSWRDEALGCGPPPPKRALAAGLETRRVDGWTARRAPLPGQEARTAAEMNEQLPLAQPAGLHHGAEGLVRCSPPGKEKRGTSHSAARVTAPTVPPAGPMACGADAEAVRVAARAALAVTPWHAGSPAWPRWRAVCRSSC